MYGSLSEFIDVRRKIKLATVIGTQPIQHPQPQQQQEQDRRNSACYLYEAQDKSLYLKAKAVKNQKKYRHAGEMLKFAMELEEKVKEPVREHWVEKGIAKRNNLNTKHQLLRAIVKTKEMEATDNKHTLFEKSFGRIMSAYSKIKTQPIDTLLPPKLIDIEQNTNLQSLEPPRKKHHSLEASKIIELENSVKWAKKHGKKVQNFYTELGKSYELIDRQKPGKSNYKLQQQLKHELQQSKRRASRKNKFFQIQQYSSTGKRQYLSGSKR